MQGAPRRRWTTGAAALAGLLLLSLIAVETPESRQEQQVATSGGSLATTELGVPLEGETTDATVAVAATEDGTATDAAAGAGGPAAATSPSATGTRASGPAASSGSGLQCRAGANGGGTDAGVTGDRIRLAATNVRSGVGSSFLGTAYIGMQAVVNRVNAEGGVCGRLLELRLVDDGWDAARGATFLQNFIKEDYFALPVVPSSEGLTQAIINGTIRNAGVPVVGSDGMLKEQYDDPWVWPVATATVSTIRIMTKHAADNGAKSFGIVFDQRYRFGREGAAAFKDYVRQLTGKDPVAFQPLTPGKSDYNTEAQTFNEACGSEGCDFVAMLLDPITANVYISSQPEEGGRKKGFGRLLTGGAQPLFNERFARDCGQACEGMLVWTGYNPPIGGLSSKPDVAAYVNDVKSVDPGVDVNNQFLQGSYLGMRVFVQALQDAGPNLTRKGVAEAMNRMTFTSDLSSPLTWRADQRFANQAAQAFRITTAAGSFAGFAEAGTGFIKDPTPGVVPSS